LHEFNRSAWPISAHFWFGIFSGRWSKPDSVPIVKVKVCRERLKWKEFGALFVKSDDFSLKKHYWHASCNSSSHTGVSQMKKIVLAVFMVLFSYPLFAGGSGSSSKPLTGSYPIVLAHGILGFDDTQGLAGCL